MKVESCHPLPCVPYSHNENMNLIRTGIVSMGDQGAVANFKEDRNVAFFLLFTFLWIFFLFNKSRPLLTFIIMNNVIRNKKGGHPYHISCVPKPPLINQNVSRIHFYIGIDLCQFLSLIFYSYPISSQSACIKSQTPRPIRKLTFVYKKAYIISNYISR